MIQPAVHSVRSGAHWTIYLPSLAVAGTWGLVYVWAVTREPALSAIAAIALAVEAVVVPLLLVHAFLRARVLAAEAGEGRLHLVWGYPFRQHLEIDLGEIAVAQVRRPLAQRIFGGGALALITRQGKRHLVADLADAEAIAEAINNAIRRNAPE